MTSAPSAVELRGLSKSFGSLAANAEVSLTARAGTVHAIIGENGAGKSTAMKMLYGVYRPDAGEIRVRGELKRWASPSDAIASGIGMVHQHFMLAGPYSVLENILVGAEPSGGIFRYLPRPFRVVDRKAARKRLEALSRQYGLAVHLDARVEDLSVGEQQRIEILKLLYREASILILDEPTAVLTPQETEELFANLRKLCGEGKTVLIITHKLGEVLRVADQVTVFRAGRVVGDRPVAGATPDELAALMVGRKVSLHVEPPPPPVLGPAVLEVEGLQVEPLESRRSTRPVLAALDFRVRGGEIVGIAGVEGNGQSELLSCLLHPGSFARRSTGAIRYFGNHALLEGRAELSTAEIKASGVGVIPEDRHRQGLMLESSVRENFLLGLQRRAPFVRRGFIARRRLDEAARKAGEAYDIRPRGLEVRAGGMSGGNQQKLIISREFETAPRLLIAAQPTRGVDVGAIEFIHKRIIQARNDGAGVLLVSSELDEVLDLSDRILVMYEGRIVAEFARGEASVERIGLSMAGGAPPERSMS